MILDENLFEDSRGSKAGVKRGPYNTSKKQEKDILDYNKIYDDLCDLGYTVYSTGEGLTFGKREEEALAKGKEYLDKLNIEYKIDYKGYPKKYYLSFELDEKALKEPKDELMKESTFTTQDPRGNEIRYEVEDDGTITVYEGDEVITKGKTNTESAKKVFNELGFKEIVKEDSIKNECLKEDWRFIDKVDDVKIKVNLSDGGFYLFDETSEDENDYIDGGYKTYREAEAAVKKLKKELTEDFEDETLDRMDMENVVKKYLPYARPEVILYYIYGYDFDEISSALNTHAGTIRGRIDRNIWQLRRLYLGYKPDANLERLKRENALVDMEALLDKIKNHSLKLLIKKIKNY